MITRLKPKQHVIIAISPGIVVIILEKTFIPIRILNNIIARDFIVISFYVKFGNVKLIGIGIPVGLSASNIKPIVIIVFLILFFLLHAYHNHYVLL